MKGILKYLILFYFLLSSFLDDSAAAKAKNGELNLRNWDGKDIITLDGEWRFYWNVFLSDSIGLENTSHKELIVDVPSYWTEYYIDSLCLPGKGYGSYSLTIYLPKQVLNSELALDIPVFDDSYSLFVNGEKVASNGVVGLNSDQAKPGYKPNIVFLYPESEKLEIVIHVSNYKHRRGGFWKSIRLSESEKLLNQKEKYELIVYITIGIIFSAILFFSFFFIFNKKNTTALFFSLSMFGILLRIISTDNFVIQIFSDPPWEWLIRFEYLGTYIAFVFATWYFHALYPNKIIKVIIRLNTVLVVLICLFVIVLEPAYFSYTMYYFKPVVLIFSSYYLLFSFVQIFKRNENDEYYFAALLVFLIALINDIRVSGSSSGIMNDYTIHFALQVFIFIHAILMIHKWIKAYKEKEKLNFEIEYLNLKLEKRINDSEEEINSDKKEILNQQEEILLIKKALDSEVKLSKKMQHVIANELRSPISSLSQVSSYLSSSYGQGELLETISSIRDMSSTANNLLDNLLFWARSQQAEIHSSPQVVKIHDLIYETLSLFKLDLKQKSIDSDLLISEELTTYCDPHLVKIVLKNLLSNALKYSNKNGRILISATHVKDEEEIILIIEDKGIGISVEMLNRLNSSANIDDIDIRKGTLNEKGPGIGLNLSKELLRINKGKMKIESTIRKGTRVMVYLPGAE